VRRGSVGGSGAEGAATAILGEGPVAESIWWKHRDVPVPTGEPPHDKVDVAVVGAGVTGLTAALLLARAGRSVVVLEARHPGAVTTGRTTGKVSALQGTMLSRILRAGRRESAAAYVASTLRAQQWLADEATGLGLDLEQRPAATYAPTSRATAAVRREHEAARDLGLPVRWSDAPDLPVPAVAATLLDDQLQLDPGQLVERLLAAALEAGATVVGDARVQRVRQRRDGVHLHVARTDGEADVHARHVLLATGAPVVDRRMHFARLTAQRSYIVAFGTAEVPETMTLSAGGPSRSFRGAEVDGRRVLLVGGAGHETGRGRAENKRVDELRRWTAEHWPDAVELGAWSAQDYTTTDHLPLVGSLGGPSPDVHLATGFNKWGLTSGVAAALAFAGEVLGVREPWVDDLYGRRARLRDVPALAGIQVGVALGGAAAAAGLAAPVETSGRRAVGEDCRLLPVCTHLGGPLRWNPHEGSYDCPLHGSRFDRDGRVLEGPATRPLRRLPTRD